MNDIKGSVIILLCVINVLLLFYISILWSQKTNLQESMNEIEEVNELKRKIITKGDLLSYNLLSEKDFLWEDMFICDIIMADVYHRSWCCESVNSSLQHVYATYGLEMNPMAYDMMEVCLSHGQKAGQRSDLTELTEFYEMRDEALARYNRMKKKSHQLQDTFEQISKQCKFLDGKIEDVSVIDSLYCFKYSYRCDDTTYYGMTYSENDRSIGDSLRIVISSANKKLSMDDVMYQLCYDNQSMMNHP